MWKHITIATVLGLFLVSCATMPTGKTQAPQEVVVKVEAANPTNVNIDQKKNAERRKFVASFLSLGSEQYVEQPIRGLGRSLRRRAGEILLRHPDLRALPLASAR